MWKWSLCMLSLISHCLCAKTPWPNETCKLVDLDALVHCKETLSAMTGHRIPESFNESQLDTLAHEAVFLFRACPAFNIEFQCFKYFPRCDNSTAATFVTGMCTESCLDAKRYQGGFCETLDINGICADKTYFDPQPDCVAFQVDTNQPDDAWKLILGAVLGTFGFIALCSLAVGSLRARLYKPDNDPVDFEDERREAERLKKLQEKAAKQGAEYVDMNVQEPVGPTARRWTSAQDAREEAVTRQRQATLAREQELAQISEHTLARDTES